MKRAQRVLVGILVALPILGAGAVAYAQGFRSGDVVTIPSGQTVDQTLFIAGHSIDIAGTVNGDIFCAGQTVNITGIVNGDVLCAGQSVNVSGTVHGSVRLAGQDVLVGATVDRSMAAAGQDVTLEAGGTIAGDASLAGQSTTVNGNINRDLAGAAGAMVLNGVVGRNVHTRASSLALGSTAKVNGDITYVSMSELSRANGAQVLGTITHTEPTRVMRRMGYPRPFANAWFALYLFLTLLVLSILLAVLLPWLFQSATRIAMHAPLKVFLVGVVSSIVVPVIIGVLFVSFIGLPFGILLGIAWLLAAAIAGPLAAYYLGRLVLRSHPTNVLLVMLVGASILLLLDMVPFIGVIIWLIAEWFGLGMMVLQLARLPRPRYTIEPAVHPDTRD